MNGILDPVGERPTSVYWRRRAIVFVVFAVGVLLLSRACGGGGPEIGTPVVQRSVPLMSTFTPTPTPTLTPTPSSVPTKTVGASTGKGAKTPKPKATVTATSTPTTDPEPAGPVTCAKKVLQVTVRADQDVYGDGEKPKLFIAVRNTGDTACLVNLGSKALTFTVMSGNDRIWSSDDCQKKGTKDIRRLKPGQALEARSVWSKVRSQPGCPKYQADALPGYYLVEASAGGVEAEKRAVFRLT